jgi:hypothetical protein
MSSLRAKNQHINTLFDPQVGVNRSIPSCPSQILPLSVLNVLPVLLDVPLRQSKIDDEDFVGSFVKTNAKIIRFDVSVDEVSVVDVLYPGDHLVDEHEGSFKGKLSESFVEEILEGRAHQIHNKDIIVAYVGAKLPSVEQ